MTSVGHIIAQCIGFCDQCCLLCPDAGKVGLGRGTSLAIGDQADFIIGDQGPMFALDGLMVYWRLQTIFQVLPNIFRHPTSQNFQVPGVALVLTGQGGMITSCSIKVGFQIG